MSRALPNPRRPRNRRRGRGRSRRRRNPWTRGQKIAAVAGVGASIGIALWVRHWVRKNVDPLWREPKPETINFNYVPHLSTWPHMDRYANEYAFAWQLEAWGYDPGRFRDNPTWTIIDAQPIEAVREFQQAYNLVRQIELPAPVPTPPLVEDGLIGNSTATAFWDAEQWTTSMNLTWPNLVELAWAELGIA